MSVHAGLWWSVWGAVASAIAYRAWADWRKAAPDDKAERWAIRMTALFFAAILAAAAVVIGALT